MAQEEEQMAPRLRGVSHAVAFWLALVGAGVLVAGATGSAARLAAVVYGVGLCSLFAASALYHRWPGDPRWRPLLRRVDHSAIFVFIAASYTPVAVLVLDDTLATAVLVAVWAGALAGVTFSILWIGAPRWLTAATYLALGWVAVVTVPDLMGRLDPAPLVLIAAGGVLYTLGAVVYARRRPDPWPQVFGFHEVFHAFVIAAAVAHYAAMAGWVIT